MQLLDGLPRGHFRTVYLDPPWKMSMGTEGRPQHYPRMTDDEIAAMGPALAALAHPDGCHFFVWITSPITERFWSDIYPVWKRHGIRFSARAFVWVKLASWIGRFEEVLMRSIRKCLHRGMGLTTIKNAEDVLLFKVGRPKRLSTTVHEIILAPVREHSRKPPEAADRIEQYSAGPYLEIFARQSREGWVTVGNEAGKFDPPAEAAAA